MASVCNDTWSTDMISFFIDLIQDNRAVWDHRHPNYHKKGYRNSIFVEICEQLTNTWPSFASLFTIGKCNIIFIFLSYFYKLC